MDGGCQEDLAKQNNPELLPSLAKHPASKEAPGFDHDEYTNTTPSNHQTAIGINVEASQSQANLVTLQLRESIVQANQSHPSHSISLNMPASPCGLHRQSIRKVLFTDEADRASTTHDQPDLPPRIPVGNAQQPNLKLHPQPIPAGNACNTTAAKETIPDFLGRSKSDHRTRDKRYDSFKTWSGRLERQLSILRGRPMEEEPEPTPSLNSEHEALPVERYLDALEGPEWDTLKPSEESALPEDMLWPFLLRFPISSFGICLGVGSQATLWKLLGTSPSTKFLNISPTINLVLWCITLVLMVGVSFIYSLKVIFYFAAVQREYYHPVRVNFFFVPWIVCLLLFIGLPPSIAENPHRALWYALMAPLLCLELKIYGQWMSGEERRLSKVANPSTHLSILGNFYGALLGSSMGLKEGPIFFFAVGLAHYIVLFITLYQRLPTNEKLPKELHPVFFLFVGVPSVACIAWERIRGDFDYGSRIAYFIALFLYASLAVRVNFFRGFRFSLAWWAYTSPVTAAAIATIAYSNEVRNPVTRILSVGLSSISTVTVATLLVTMIIHAFVLKDLFPNDVSIAITERKAKSRDLELEENPVEDT